MSEARAGRELGLLWGAAALAALALATLANATPLLALLPDCPFRAVTGWPCPGCGAGRALAALARGELAAALRFNPLAAAGAVLFVVGGLAAATAALAARPLPEPRVLSPWGRLALAAGLAANWIYLVRAGR